MAPRTALLLINPHARNGKTGLRDIKRIFKDNDITCIVPDKKDRDLSRTIRHYAKKVDLVIIGGGDGTLNAAAKGLMETKLPLGILPLGTANDLVRTLGLPMDPVEAAKLIGTIPLRSMDMGEVNGHPFFNVASIGLGATLAGSLSPDLKKRFGVMGYMLGTLSLIARQRPFGVSMNAGDGPVYTRTFNVAVGNGSYYGGGLRLDAWASPEDGKLHVYSLEANHWVGLLPLAPFMKFGLHGAFRSVRTFEAKSLTIATRKSRPVNVDGELATQTPATFKVLRKAVRVYAPKPVKPKSK